MNIFEIAATEKVKHTNNLQFNCFFYQIGTLDGALSPIHIDENVINVLGYHANELVDKSFNELKIIAKNYHQVIQEYYKIAKENAKQYEFKTVLIHKDGYPVFIRNRGASFANEDGIVDQFIGCIESISSIDIQDLQPETTRQIIKIAHDCGSVGTFYYDIKLNKLHWSDEVKKMHGYETEPTIEEFGTLIQSKEKFSKENIIKKVVSSKHGYQTIYSYFRKEDNTETYILAIMFPIIDDKKNLISISGNVINLFDQTEVHYLSNQIRKQEKSYSEEDSVFIKQHQEYIKIPIKDIVAISSMRDYIQIYTKNRIPPYIYYTTLYKFKEKLPQNLFFQIHRSHVINISLISKISSNQLIVNDLVFPISRNYKPKLIEIINKRT